MKIAILGATSEIAKDLILSFFTRSTTDLVLYSRNPTLMEVWCKKVGIQERYLSSHYQSLDNDGPYDAVINFVGSGNPARILAMGSTIFNINQQYDDMVFSYLQKYPTCRYLYMSSGVAYGTNFEVPVNQETRAEININNFHAQDFYSFSKLYSEGRHRLLREFFIVDIRIFNYFSKTQDLSSRFLISDIMRSILDKTLLQTSGDNIVRDFLNPSDFYQLVSAILCAQPTNAVVDAYTLSPVSKIELLEAMKNNFGLRYMVSESNTSINATGTKPCYYSLNRRAKDFGYSPAFTSLGGILQEANEVLNKNNIPGP